MNQEPPRSTNISTLEAIDTEIDKLKVMLEKLEKKPESKQENAPLGFMKGIFKG